MWEIYRRFRRAFDRSTQLAPSELSPLEVGQLGERLAVEYLQRRQFMIVATNFTAPLGINRNGRAINGEIDIVAYDESTHPCVLAFIEVKTRTSAVLALPEAAVDRRKQRQIIRVSRVYRRLMGVSDEPSRYDVVTILLDPAEEPQISCLLGYFSDREYNRGARAVDFLP